jgi:hypothetical protein
MKIKRGKKEMGCPGKREIKITGGGSNKRKEEELDKIAEKRKTEKKLVLCLC